uniref:undecaprenyl-diphosphate phosphatase n=1 Tax=Pararhizobium sp. IMCC3301 TaxID=3067904 RepID=UPI00274069A6|nr:undecaprenyl-diphosphate phosphatase [Pararhizobium sp. IMCC3301]
MDQQTLFEAAFLGLLEGLTEFLPVSSTGHILLAGHFLGFESEGKVFEVLIQFGAILAILLVYFRRLWTIALTLPSSATSRRFVAGIVLAFLPAAVIGVFAHGFIKTVLFEAPTLICIMLVLGGFVLLWVDRRKTTVRYSDVQDYPLMLALKIGLFQTIAFIPGVSRSGATIAGALLMGTDKRSAAEFSFFLAMPTMGGAFAFDLWLNRNALSGDDLSLIAVGFAVAFVAAIIVVRSLLDFVSRHGFAPFAYWRILVGTLGLIGIYLL